MSHDATTIVDQAIAWHLRTDAMTDADWPVFVDWLEADAAHASAYDAIAMQDRLIAEASFPVAPAPIPAPIMAANDDAPRPRRWWSLAGGSAIAAALALWLVPIATAPKAAGAVYATRDGARHDVTLDDGTQVAMNGGTVLRIDPADPRSVRLERGEVTLHVVHDAAHPFTLRVGDRVIRDMGTTFDVTQDDEGLSVAVAEGSVLFQPDGAAVTLTAGQGLTMAAGSGRIVRTSVAPESIGGWRTGLLDFDAAPVAKVAASLHRLYGFDIAVTGDLSKRPFTGIIRLTGAADRDVPHLADLIGATWRRDGERWVLAERANTAR